MFRARYVRVCLPRRKVGVYTIPRCSALSWRLRVLCGGGGGTCAGPGCGAGGGGLQPSPRSGGGASCAPCPTSPPFGPRAAALWAGFPVPLSCFARVSCGGKASCYGRDPAPGRASCIRKASFCKASFCKASFCSMPHCPQCVGAHWGLIELMAPVQEHTRASLKLWPLRGSARRPH